MTSCFNQVFPKKTKVILHNLKTKKFNGKCGIITRCLSKNNPKRFGVCIDGETKSIAIKPSNLMTATGVEPVFAFEQNGIKMPLKAILDINQDYNEIEVILLYSDHLGLDTLKPVCNHFFENSHVKDVIGRVFSNLTIQLEHYETKPNEIAIAKYKNGELAKCMHQQGLIKLTNKATKQGYGSFYIANINFQQMFRGDVIEKQENLCN
eukprot:423617_1